MGIQIGSGGSGSAITRDQLAAMGVSDSAIEALGLGETTSLVQASVSYANDQFNKLSAELDVVKKELKETKMAQIESALTSASPNWREVTNSDGFRNWAIATGNQPNIAAAYNAGDVAKFVTMLNAYEFFNEKISGTHTQEIPGGPEMHRQVPTVATSEQPKQKCYTQAGYDKFMDDWQKLVSERNPTAQEIAMRDEMLSALREGRIVG
jgi:hypothetical protein